MDSKIIVLIPFGLILVSLLFFSRGILIFLTTLCLILAASQFPYIHSIAMQLRWVFFALFCLHVFGDIFLGRTVRSVKIFDILAIVFIIFAFLSSFYSPYPALTRERTTTILALYISVFWIIWKYAYEYGTEKVIYLMLQVIMLSLIISYLTIFMGTYKVFIGGRFAGIFGNPNGLGFTAALFLPLSLWQFLETKKKTALFLFILVSLALLLAAARGSLNATVLALGYLIYVRSRKNRPFVFFFSMSLILIFIWVIETLIKEYFMIYIRAETIPILGGRLDIWPVALNLIMDKPIFGYGFGVEDKLFALKGFSPPGRPVAYVHNSYLGMTLQMGLVGFVLFFIPLFILLLKELFSKQIGEPKPLLRHALCASLIAGLTCSFYESGIYTVGNAQTFPFWVIVMLLVFYRYHDKDKNMVEST